MKSIKIIMSLVLVLALGACSTDYNDINEEIIIASFTGTEGSPNVRLTSDDPVLDRGLEVTTNIPSSSDIVFNVAVDADATEIGAASYSFDSSFTLPAGETTFVLPITFMQDASLTEDYQNITIKFIEDPAYAIGTAVSLNVRYRVD